MGDKQDVETEIGKRAFHRWRDARCIGSLDLNPNVLTVANGEQIELSAALRAPKIDWRVTVQGNLFDDEALPTRPDLRMIEQRCHRIN